MKDESSGSTPDDTGDPRRSSRRIAGTYSYWTCGASSGSLSRGVAGCRPRWTRSLPGRLPMPVSEPSRLTNSELRASSAFPARLMEPSTFDEDYKILKCLVSHKLSIKDKSSWYPTDAKVQRRVLPLLRSLLDIDATKVKQRIEAFELIVKKHLEQTEQLVENKELLLDVLFSYVMPDFVLRTYEEPTLRIPSPRGQKRTSIYLDEKDGSAIQHRSKRSSCSESVDHHLDRLLDQREAGPIIRMGHCTQKLQRCGFSDQLLYHAIDILKADLELREIFISLGDPNAKGYILHVLRKSHV